MNKMKNNTALSALMAAAMAFQGCIGGPAGDGAEAPEPLATSAKVNTTLLPITWKFFDTQGTVPLDLGAGSSTSIEYQVYSANGKGASDGIEGGLGQYSDAHDGEIYWFPVDGPNGTFKPLRVDSRTTSTMQETWVVGEDGSVYTRTETFSPFSIAWKRRSTAPVIRDITVAKNGTVWAVGGNLSRSGGGWQVLKYASGKWTAPTGGYGNRITVDDAGKPWVVRADQKVYQYDTSAKKWLTKTATGDLKATAIGFAKGSIWIVGNDLIPEQGGGSIWRFTPSTSTYQKVNPGRAMEIDADHGNGLVYVITAAGHVAQGKL